MPRPAGSQAGILGVSELRASTELGGRPNQSAFGFLLSGFWAIMPTPKNAMALALEELLEYRKAINFAGVVCASTKDFMPGYEAVRRQRARAQERAGSGKAEGSGQADRAGARQRIKPMAVPKY